MIHIGKNSTRRWLCLMALSLLSAVVWAQEMSEQQVRERVLQFLETRHQSGTRAAVTDLQLTATPVEAARLYAFNIEGGGYVVASADSRTMPVLGYSDKGHIHWDRLPLNMQSWLKGYSKVITALDHLTDFADRQSSRAPATTTEWPSIKPLLKTAWAQYSPYSKLTPLYDGANDSIRGFRSLTGCVATSMAQVMNYYQWPQEVCREIPAYDIETTYKEQTKVWHVDSLPPVTFDWTNMLSCYWPEKKLIGTDREQLAVATLMRYCGQAVNMEYSPEASAATHQAAAEAYVRYFGYDPSLKLVSRVYYGIDEWEALVYEELSEGRPLHYGGFNTKEGHSFICDGYDRDGFFHINWGWDGYLDGYFLLSVLNQYEYDAPERSSIGVGFNAEEEMIIGIRPAPEGTEVPDRLLPCIALSQDIPLQILQPDTAAFIFYFETESYGSEEVRADYAFGTCDDGGRLSPIFIGDPADSIVYSRSQNIFFVKIDSTAFCPGEQLLLYPMVRLRSIPGSDWQMLGSKEFCIHTGQTADGLFYLYYQMPELEVVRAEVSGGLFCEGATCDITFTIRNKSNFETTLPLKVVPRFYGDITPEKINDDTPFELGEDNLCGLYLHAGEEAPVTCDFKLLRSGLVDFEVLSSDGVHIGHVFMTIGSSTSISGSAVFAGEDSRWSDGGYTDLKGRRLTAGMLRKGIYIRDDRKVIIR